GLHSVKFGVDFRRLSPLYNPSGYNQAAVFFGVPPAETGHPFIAVVGSNLKPTFLFRNIGIYAQDMWRVFPRLTLNYGLRLDVDSVPQSSPTFPAVTGFSL